MPTLREVRSRITGVKKTQKITRAMKMVAAAKLRRAQASVIAARPYASGMRALLQDLLPALEPGAEPLLTARPVRTLGLVVLTSDRGMCGAFNSNLLRAALSHLERSKPDFRTAQTVQLYTIGKKGTDFVSKQSLPIAGRYPGFFNTLNFAQSQAVAREIIEQFLRGDIDRVDVIYNEFKSVTQQRIMIDQFLPLVPEAREPVPRQHEYIYEPSREELLRALLPRFLHFSFWRMLLESNASEQGARMAAMENATENANEMIETLQLQYNKARQGAITRELLEIVSGAEALKGGD